MKKNMKCLRTQHKHCSLRLTASLRQQPPHRKNAIHCLLKHNTPSMIRHYAHPTVAHHNFSRSSPSSSLLYRTYSQIQLHHHQCSRLMLNRTAQTLPHRSIFNLFSTSDQNNTDSNSSPNPQEISRFSQKKIILAPQNIAFSVVADVDSYSTFLPFCTESKILSHSRQTKASRAFSTNQQKIHLSSNATHVPKTNKDHQLLEPEVNEEFDEEFEAELVVGFQMLQRESWVSRVQLKPNSFVKVQSSSQVFKYLTNTWHFEALDTDACRITFNVDFAFNSPIHTQLLSSVFTSVQSQTLAAFETQILKVYRQTSK